MPVQPFPRPSLRSLVAAIAAVTLLHSLNLWTWAEFAWGHDLFSYTLLVPVVSVYLAWTTPALTEFKDGRPHWPLAAGFAVVAVVLFLAGPSFGPSETMVQQALSWKMASWVFSVWAAVAATAGIGFFRLLPFPLFFLFLATPLSPWGEATLESFLQYGSAETSSLYFWLTGMTFYREGLTFHLPGISLHVAPECSGIHSTIVLFVTSLVAGHLFLKSNWRRFALSAAVLPLGLLRNGFRVWTLGTLCVYDDPKWIKSPLHHQGGPIFFALSLIPFGLLLWLLYRRERRAEGTQAATLVANVNESGPSTVDGAKDTDENKSPRPGDNKGGI